MMACLPLQKKIGSDWDKLYGHRENVGKNQGRRKTFVCGPEKSKIWHHKLLRSRGNAPWSQCVCVPKNLPNLSKHPPCLNYKPTDLLTFCCWSGYSSNCWMLNDSHVAKHWSRLREFPADLYIFILLQGHHQNSGPKFNRPVLPTYNSLCLCICESCPNMSQYLCFTPFCQLGHQLFTPLSFK